MGILHHRQPCLQHYQRTRLFHFVFQLPAPCTTVFDLHHLCGQLDDLGHLSHILRDVPTITRQRLPILGRTFPRGSIRVSSRKFLCNRSCQVTRPCVLSRSSSMSSLLVSYASLVSSSVTQLVSRGAGDIVPPDQLCEVFFLSFLLFVRFWRVSPRLSRASHLRTVGLGFCGVVQSQISVVAQMFREVNRTSQITYSLHLGFRASLQLCCRLHTTINQDKIERQRVVGTGYHAATCSDSLT
jgi:hypothetical protein